MPLELATRGIAYITAAMSEATPPSHPYYLYLLAENVCLPLDPNGDPFKTKTLHHYCHLGELTDSQYCELEDWLCQFQKEDKFVVDLTSVYKDGDAFVANIGAFIEFKVARITEQTSGELKKLIESGHDDYQRNLAAGRERVLEDDHSPYRVLYEVRRKAAFFSGRAIDDAEFCQTSVTGGTSKPRNGSSPSPVSTAATSSGKKRGRPQSKRNPWIIEQSDAGLKPAAIRDMWNELSQAEREIHDPSNPAIYSNKSRTDDGRNTDVESIRYAIKRERKRRQIQKKS